MTEPLSIIFTIERGEYLRAMRRHYQSRLHGSRDIAAGMIMIGGGIYLLYLGEPFMAWFLIVAGVILLGMVAYAFLLLPQILYRSQPKLQSEYRLKFDEEGIRFQTDHIDAQLKWQMYHSWIRDDEFYILYHGTRELSVLPRRAIPEGGGLQFEELLTRKIGAHQANYSRGPST